MTSEPSNKKAPCPSEGTKKALQLPVTGEYIHRCNLMSDESNPETLRRQKSVLPAPLMGGTSDMPDEHQHGFLPRLLSGAVAGVSAEASSMPLDTMKARIMSAPVAATGSSSSSTSGFFGSVRHVIQTEGVNSLWRGMSPAAVRQFGVGAVGMTNFEPVRNNLVKLTGRSGDQANYADRCLAGGISGSLGIMMLNPAELIKVQMQTRTDGSKPWDLIKKIYQSEGIPGFWFGVKANVAKVFLMYGVEVGTYDEVKTRSIPYFGDTIVSHLIGSVTAGILSTIVVQPADLIKTRVMDQSGSASERVQYTGGPLSVLSTIAKEEGFAGITKGFFPFCIRNIIFLSVFFVTFENSRKFWEGKNSPLRILGLQNFNVVEFS